MDILELRLKKFFWDCDFSSLNWDSHRDFIIRRILTEGDWEALRWLRTEVGDEDLRLWLIRHEARGLSPRQTRYWALILDIDPVLTDKWVSTARQLIWSRKA
jgi:hypothetical protein